ncbi:uncharacterized protein LOC112606328 [Theropithecus gelada]|uniref:uncharacterized protein LOC112606328 n=1 Tax=Theropithecus gelada TaxID=9565 RepID=UPI000DC19C34|nr:uncharacterized protein LOC112606328 [Theropithecus gelada]
MASSRIPRGYGAPPACGLRGGGRVAARAPPRAPEDFRPGPQEGPVALRHPWSRLQPHTASRWSLRVPKTGPPSRLLPSLPPGPASPAEGAAGGLVGMRAGGRPTSRGLFPDSFDPGCPRGGPRQTQQGHLGRNSSLSPEQ